MTPEDALLELQSLVAFDVEPTLSSEEVERLLARARRPDVDGLLPDDDGWTPTYDLNRAASQGWRIKAGKVANRYAIATDGQTMNRNQMIEHCLLMANQYGKRVQQTMAVGVADEELLNGEILL